MLPAVARTATAALTALAIAAVPAAPAQAWGRNEQNFLKGVAATLLVGAIYNQMTKPPRQVAPATPVYAPVPQVPSYGSVHQSPAARAFQTYTAEERRAIQRRLATMGYYRAGIDGSFGPATNAAVTAYARDRGQAERLASVQSAFAVYDGLLY
ncbi:MAG: peptidoglycan-binding protein [Rhodobacteraceae bacterium]|nr:peptidoglycan-binding protein [Paracoccaceae bacterium]